MIDSYIAFYAQLQPTAPAVVTLEGSVTFARFDADIDRVAQKLRHLEVPEAEAIAVDLADAYLHWVTVLALARLGLASAPPAETNCQFRIGDREDVSPTVDLVFDRRWVDRTFKGPRVKMARSHPKSNALGRVLHSSGTTGEEKRIGMSWRVMDAGIRNALISYGAPEGPWLASTGINTILGFLVTLACWAAGNPAVLGLRGELRAEHLAQLRPRLIALVPDQLKRLLDGWPHGAERWPLRIVSGGGPVPPELARRTRLQLTANLRSVYGSSETGAVSVADLALLERRTAAAGYVLPGVEVEILDDDGNAAPAGSLGRVRIRSERVAGKYLDDLENSAGAFRDGWFYPGDLGRLEDDGLLLIEGRSDDLMNLAGHKVLPGWVEQAVLSCAGVADAAAFSVPDENGLERCWLAIVTTSDFSPSGLAPALQRQLVWLPKIEYIVVSAIPRNHMGKIERNRLRKFALSSMNGQVGTRPTAATSAP